MNEWLGLQLLLVLKVYLKFLFFCHACCFCCFCFHILYSNLLFKFRFVPLFYIPLLHIFRFVFFFYLLLLLSFFMEQKTIFKNRVTGAHTFLIFKGLFYLSFLSLHLHRPTASTCHICISVGYFSCFV